MLLDNGLSCDNFSKFWDHAMTDLFHLGCGDPQHDKFWNDTCTWTFKMLLLGASYDHILDEFLREFICWDINDYDIHNFRNWKEYEYFFDTTYCDRYPELYGSVIHIHEKKTGNEVWKMGVGVAGRKILEQL